MFFSFEGEYLGFAGQGQGGFCFWPIFPVDRGSRQKMPGAAIKMP
jgi:hypothetical protein